MAYLLLAIASSAMVSIGMRITEKYVRHTMVMFTANYALCLALSRLYLGNTRPFLSEKGIGLAAVLGIISGVFYLLGFVLLQKNVRYNGVVLSSAAMKLGSVMIPVLAAILLFHEAMGKIQLAGISIAALAVVLMNMEKGNAHGSRDFADEDCADKDFEAGDNANKNTADKACKKSWLILLLLVSGFTDTMANIYDKTGTEVLKNHYLFYTFLAALVTAFLLALLGRQRIRLEDIGSGLLIAIPNYYSARFLLLSLGAVPAVIAYPVYSAGTMIITGIVGMLIFCERLGTQKKLALFLILAALVLLNI